MSANLPEI